MQQAAGRDVPPAGETPAPKVLVLSTLFPSPASPNAGLFIRERMFRVARRLPLAVVSPQPWFPLQSAIRWYRPGFRPPAPAVEQQQGIAVHRPRFLSVPGLLRSLDGGSIALCCRRELARLRESFPFDIIDSHFAYPDGYAATLLGQHFGVPVTITLRGTEVPHARDPRRRRRMLDALARADQVFSVSESLRQHAISMGADPARIRVVGNGVDAERYAPLPRGEARAALGLPPDAQVLVSVGGLVERKGFHRVIELLPRLLQRFPGLHYLVVGGPSPEGDWSGRLRDQVAQLGLERQVHMLGAMPPDKLREPLSAADVFVLATRNEGWANVFLEAMACGLPVVTTAVGGNEEVVAHEGLGIVVPFGDPDALEAALARALTRDWDRDALIAHARANVWETRVDILVNEFRRLASERWPLRFRTSA